MGILNRLAGKFGYQKKTIAPTPAHQFRMFSAGLQSRLTSGWVTTNASADADIFRALDTMRARSRDLANNNDYIKKWLRMIGNNVVGPSGFSLQCQSSDPSGKIDKLANDTIEGGFDTWARRGVCDISGQHSFVDLSQLAIKAVARDGEALIRRIRGRKVNAFGYALQLIDIDRLLVNYNQQLGANFIRMGIEMDSYGRPVAYHLRSIHPGESMPVTIDGKAVYMERVPANDMFHLFMADRPEQRRGIPWSHSAMTRINMLAGYEDAALVASRTGAAKMGFFTSPDGDASPLSDGTDEKGDFVTDAEPGTFSILPKGYDFKEWNPDYPQANYDAFVKACLRGISSGLGVAYNSLANDLEGVNFSSIRAGLLEERDSWMVIQNWMTEALMRPVYLDWLQMALAIGVLKMPNGSALPVQKFDKFAMHTWQGRRWAWVDPLKDVEANLAAVNGGLKSRREVIAEQGRDIDDVWAQLQKEELDAAKMGLNFNKDLVPGQPQNSVPAAPDAAA
jgi:lambda family phage portal protein